VSGQGGDGVGMVIEYGDDDGDGAMYSGDGYEGQNVT